MSSFPKLENGRIFIIVLSSLTFIVLSVFSRNLIQQHLTLISELLGDWGCMSNTDATMSNMDAKNPQFVLGLGVPPPPVSIWTWFIEAT